MNRHLIAHFEVIPRARRARHLVPTIRRCSRRFKKSHAVSDEVAMSAASEEAWAAMTALFDVLRNEHDHGHLPGAFMQTVTAMLVRDVTSIERMKMISERKLDRKHPNIKSISLRDILNKIAHYDANFATYRLDGRRAHYLILSGPDQNLNKGPWVAEVLVSRLCRNAHAAVKAIT
jgi:hypothetical protein